MLKYFLLLLTGCSTFFDPPIIEKVNEKGLSFSYHYPKKWVRQHAKSHTFATGPEQMASVWFGKLEHDKPQVAVTQNRLRFLEESLRLESSRNKDQVFVETYEDVPRQKTYCLKYKKQFFVPSEKIFIFTSGLQCLSPDDGNKAVFMEVVHRSKFSDKLGEFSGDETDFLESLSFQTAH